MPGLRAPHSAAEKHRQQTFKNYCEELPGKQPRMITNWLGGIYIAVVAGIALFGILGLVTFWFYWKHRNDRFPTPDVSNRKLPRVTVQLPIYNERLVVTRLIESAINLDYPRHLLQIQVLI